MALTGVDSQDPHVAAISSQETFEDLDAGGLARAVWPQQSKDVTTLNVKIHVIDGAQISVGLT